jgi:putative acetyltransferase
MPSTQDIVIRPVPFDHPDSVQLRTTQQAELTAQWGPDYCDPPSAADVAVFLIAYHDGKPVGCGGLRPLSSASENARKSSAEIKRMFVAPAYRGRLGGDDGARTSVAQLILEQLEGESRKRGLPWLLLETGVDMTTARRFYERCGFAQRGMFGKYSVAEASVCYEKWLGGSVS